MAVGYLALPGADFEIRFMVNSHSLKRLVDHTHRPRTTNNGERTTCLNRNLTTKTFRKRQFYFQVVHVLAKAIHKFG
jgi:hypothetical protein